MQGYSDNGNGVFGSSNNFSAGYFDISTASNSSHAVQGSTVGTGAGVYGYSEQGFGVWGVSNTAFGAAIFGVNTAGGEAITGMTNGTGTAAVAGTNSGNGGIGVSATANSGGTANGTALLASLESGPGNLAIFQVGGINKARIDAAGKGYFNGGTQNSGADVAEAFDVEGNEKSYEPGDVLVISQSSDRKVEKSSSPYSTLVAGVYATRPGLLLTEKNAVQDQIENTVPMGVVGVIPTKVSLEGGAIKRGDLLVTSSTPGVAMKADPDKVKVGQVIGKALQEYNQPIYWKNQCAGKHKIIANSKRENMKKSNSVRTAGDGGLCYNYLWSTKAESEIICVSNESNQTATSRARQNDATGEASHAIESAEWKYTASTQFYRCRGSSQSATSSKLAENKSTANP